MVAGFRLTAVRTVVAAMFAALVVAMAGCETPAPKAPRQAELTFGHLGALAFDAAALEVVNGYTAPVKAPNVEHLFPTPPARTLERWARDRLHPKGRKGKVRFVVVTASVTETPLKITKGFTGAFKKEQSERYDAVLEASVEILDDRGYRKGFASARVSRSRTVPEGITLNERHKAWFDLTEDLMGDFNAEIEKNVRAYLGGYMM